jgi:hypothetical protein
MARYSPALFVVAVRIGKAFNLGVFWFFAFTASVVGSNLASPPLSLVLDHTCAGPQLRFRQLR